MSDFFISNNCETADNFDLFSISSENLILDSDNHLSKSLSLNLDESEIQENNIFQSGLEIRKNEFKLDSLNKENSSLKKLNIETQKLPFYLTDNHSQKKDKILFAIKKDTGYRQRGRKSERMKVK